MGSNTSVPVPKQIYLAAKAGHVAELRGLQDRLGPYLGPSNQVAPERRAEILEWTDDDGRTALVVAAAKNHRGIVDMLLKLGANVHHISRKKEGGSALHEAVHKQSSREIVEMLLRHGANPFVENSLGFTALDYAILRKEVHLVRRFEQLGQFRGYLKAKVPSWGGVRSNWQSRWVAVVPRYSYPRLPRNEQVLRHLLLFYENINHQDPTCRVYLHGSKVRLANNSDMEHVCILRLHPALPKPKGLVAKGNQGGAGFSIFLKQCPFSGRGKPNDFPSLERFVSVVRDPQQQTQYTFPSEPMDAVSLGLTDDQLVYDAALLHSWLNPGVSPSTGVDATANHGSNSSPRSYPDLDPSGHSDVPQTQRPPAPSFLSQSPSATTPPVDSGMPSAPPLPESYSQSTQPVSAIAEPRNEKGPAALAAVAHDDIDDDDACVICLSAPREAGFVHGDSVHRCACKECAAEVMRQEARSCPICRQSIETVLTGFY